jgi:nitrous oxidase accessory protein NosD
LITGTGTSNNEVLSDLIGVNASGTAILPHASESYSNAGIGVEIAAGATGTAVSDCVIGGNLASVEIDSANANSITNDYIGTDATGTRSLGNLGYGVVLSQATGNVVEKNEIEHSPAYGVLTIYADQNTVSSNTYTGNAEGNLHAIG